MRRLGCLALTVCGLITVPNVVAFAATLQTSAPQAILIEADSGSVLFEKQADQPVAPASLAKLMTVDVVLDQVQLGNVKLDETFVISENAWRKGGAPSGGSTMFAALHSRVSVEDLIKGVVIHSANDGCIALAEGIAGNESAFVRMMNDRARERGLSKSYFTNVDGRPDPQMRTTAREMAFLARHLIADYPEQYQWFGQREFTWNKIRQQNRNPLLGIVDGADGLKTGSTSEAGFNLVGSAKRGEQRLIVVVTGLKTAKERADEAKKILEFGFREFETRMLFAQKQPIAEAKVFGGAQGKVSVVAKEHIRLLVPRSGNERITAKMIYMGPIQAPVREGQTIGRLQITRGNLKVLEVPLLAAENVEQGSLTQRAMDSASELVINLFRTVIKKI